MTGPAVQSQRAIASAIDDLLAQLGLSPEAAEAAVLAGAIGMILGYLLASWWQRRRRRR